MAQSYTSLLDQFQPSASSLPLTDRSAQYLRDTVKHVEEEIAKLSEAEEKFLQDAAGAKAVRVLLEQARDIYTRGLGDHANPDARRWPVDPATPLGHTETCSHCGQQMAWTEKHGYIHEVDGWWVAAGEWCEQTASTGAAES